MIRREGSDGSVVDGDDVEVDGVGDGTTLTVIDEVVEASDAIEVGIWGEGVELSGGVVVEVAVADGEVDDRESVSVGARGDVAVGVVLDVWVGDTGEEIVRGEGVGLIFLSIGNGDSGGGKNRSVVKAEDVEIDGFGDGVVPVAGVGDGEGEGGLTSGVGSCEEPEPLELGDGEVLLSANGGLTVGEVDGADCGVRDSSNGVGESLSGFVCTAADGVGEAIEAHGGDGSVLNQEESGDVSSGANGFVVNGLDVEGVGGELVSAFAIGDDVVEINGAVEIRVGGEGVFGVIDLGDEAAGGGEAKDGEGCGFTCIGVGVAGEEIACVDGVGGVFCAGSEYCFGAS